MINNEITINGITYVRKDSCKCPFMKTTENKNTVKKYCFNGETINYKGHILHRIVALKDFGGVRKGDIGGWIEKEDNLSQEGRCWVGGDAWVFGNAKVYGDARVYGNAKVYGDAKVCENARVFGNAKVRGNAWVCEGAVVCNVN